MYQYYIFVITVNQAGEYAHDVKWAFDANADTARAKAESMYYTELAKAAVSEHIQHAVTLFSADGKPIMDKCYKRQKQEEPEVQTEAE